MPRIGRNKYLKNEKIIVKNNITGRIRKLIFPHDVEFGLEDQPQFAKEVKFFNGLSGSLTHLVDGTSYIIAGAGIDVTTGSNGAITIEASGGSGTGDIQGVTAGTGLSGGGTSGTVTLNLDIAGLSTTLNQGTVNKNDLFAIADADDSNIVKKIDLEDIAEFLSGENDNSGLAENNGVLELYIHNLNEEDINVAEDFIAFSDEGTSGDPTKRESIADFITAVAGTGLTATSGVLSVDLNEVGDATVDVANDSIVIIDANASNATKKETIAHFIAGIAGTGLSESSGQLVVGSLTVAQGGTGRTSFADKSVIITQDSGSPDLLSAVPMSTNGQLLIGGTSGPAAATLTEGSNISITNSDGAITIAASGVAPGAAGSNTQVQFNDGGSALGGDSGLVYNKTTNTLTSTNISGSLTQLSDGTSYLIASGSATITTGSNGAITIHAENTQYGPGDGLDLVANGTTFALDLKSNGGLKIDVTELAIDNSVVATLTGSTFTGVTNHNAGLSGSLTKLVDGRSYLVAGDNVTIASQSNGQITISSLDTLFTAGTGLDLSGTQFSIDNRVVATLTGSTFTGVTNHNAGLSGSLTKLIDGTSYLIAGDNVSITTQSNGSIKITAAGGGSGGSGSPGGSNTQVQFNDELSFGGNANFTFNKTSNTLSVTSVTGSIIKFNKLTGSLTNVEDGTSYLIAGDNISITTQSNGSIVITGSASGGSGATTIGNAEDGTYTDGLFTDFAPTTEIGTAIDRFNEVLKSLAPSPAPDLDDVNALNTGTAVLLSFGSSNDQSSATPAYISVAGSAGISSAVDVNGSYAVVTSSNNIRLGAFDGDTHISGVLNADVVANSQGNDVQNYPAFSFGNGETGVLRLNVNGTTIKEIDFTVDLIGSGTSGIGTGSHLDANGSGFNFFSTATTGTFSNGNEFASFKHRTGQFVVASGSQRRGWNYARVLHVKTGSTSTTNYIEWVNDDNNDSLSSAGNSIDFEGSGSIHLSGIEYFRSGSAQYKVRVLNAYKYVYDNNDITFTTSTGGSLNTSPSFSIANQSKPTISTGDGETHTKTLHITGSTNITATQMLNGSITAGVNVTHPFKSNLSNAGQASDEGILIYNRTNNSTNTLETFRREDFRIISGTYNTQASLTDSGNVWNSTKHMTASNGGHTNGLQFFNQRLYSPTNTLNGGNFSTFSNGPLENPNYSGLSGQRTFYRWFRNTTGSTQYDFTIDIDGSGTTIVNAATALNSERIRAFVKFPSNGTRETGWLDLATEFVLDNYADNHGAHTANGSLTFDSSLDALNYVTLGTVGIGNNEYIGLRIEADESWTGYISQITVSFGAGTGTISAVPDLDDLDCNDTGVTAALSFGSSKSLTGYTNSGTAAGFSAIDLNGTYQVESDSNNLRRGVFDKTTIIEGDLNEDVSAISPDYPANSFSDANSGSLVLEVNGANLHSVELTGSYNLVGAGEPGSGTGTSFTGNSGFFNISVWRPAEFDNEVPYFLEIYRTARFRVHTNDQRDGWNYARVKHVGSWGTRQTNYVEWINDSESQNNNVSSAGDTITQFGDDDIFHLSGVKYFVNPTGSIETRVSNIYKNIYSTSTSAVSLTSLTNANAISIVQTGLGITSTKTENDGASALQTLNTNANSQNEVLHVTGTIQFSQAASLSGSFQSAMGINNLSCGSRITFVHPIKDDYLIPAQTTTNMLVYSASDNSTHNTEYFNGEKYRIQSGTFATQNSITAATHTWSSTGSLNDNSSFPGYYSGLMVYGGLLISPIAGGAAGKFRNKHEGSNAGIFEGPNDNVDYSSLGEDTREYFRYFENTSSNDLARFAITLRGDAEIVSRATSKGANKNCTIELKVPGKNEFVDLAVAFSVGAGDTPGQEGDGCLSGTLISTITTGGVLNEVNFGTNSVLGTGSGPDAIVMRITAHKNWTGYISQADIRWSIS